MSNRIHWLLGMGIFLVETDLNSPPVFDHFLRTFEASHEISVLLHINRIPKYHVCPISQTMRENLCKTGTN